LPVMCTASTQAAVCWKVCRLCVAMGCSRAAVVLATAAVHWRQERWAEAGAVLEAAAEFCSSRLAWRVSISHALLMQGAPCDRRLSCTLSLSPHGWCMRQHAHALRGGMCLIVGVPRWCPSGCLGKGV